MNDQQREYVKTINGLHIYFESRDEDIPASEAFSFEQTGIDYHKLIGDIKKGKEDYFTAKISAVDPETGEEVKAEYLGCCVYTPARSFIKDSSYFEGMAEACALGKST